MEELRQKVRKVLNGINSDNLESRFAELISLQDISSMDGINACVESIFDSATKGRKFTTLMAEISSRLELVGTFKSKLLSKCQQRIAIPLKSQVEKRAAQLDRKIDNEPDGDKKRLLENQRDYQLSNVVSQYYGNIRFVGELYLKDVIPARLVNNYVPSLFKLNDTDNSMSKEALNCLCEVLRAVGKKLDGDPEGRTYLETYFKDIDGILTKVADPQIQSKLRSIGTLRHRNWEVLGRDLPMPLVASRSVPRPSLASAISLQIGVSSRRISDSFGSHSMSQQPRTGPNRIRYSRECLLSFQHSYASCLTPRDIATYPAELLPPFDSQQLVKSKSRRAPLSATSLLLQSAPNSRLQQTFNLQLVDILFEEAIRQQDTSALLGTCKRMAHVKISGGWDNPVYFGHLLLRKCQAMFETSLNDLRKRKSTEWDAKIVREHEHDKIGSLEKMRDEQLKLVETEYYGNIRFMAQMYTEGIATSDLVNHCVEALLNNSIHTCGDTCSHSVLGLYELLMVAGKMADSTPCLKQKMTPWFERINELIGDKSIESDARTKLTHLAAAREQNWVDKSKF